MKTTVVPAQITTDEDKVAGNLSLTQMVLLAAAILASFGLYIVMSPHMGFSFVKVFVCLGVLVFGASLALRYRGRILAQWIILIAHYYSRPGMYVYNKNDKYLRDANHTALEAHEEPQHKAAPQVLEKPKTLPAHQIFQLERVIATPETQLAFQTTKKGDVYVHITEIK